MEEGLIMGVEEYYHLFLYIAFCSVQTFYSDQTTVLCNQQNYSEKIKNYYKKEKPDSDKLKKIFFIFFDFYQRPWRLYIQLFAHK